MKKKSLLFVVCGLCFCGGTAFGSSPLFDGLARSFVVIADNTKLTGLNVTSNMQEEMTTEEELVVQCELLTDENGEEIILSDSVVYDKYTADFLIKETADQNYRLVTMDLPQGNRYVTRYELPAGSYSYYISVKKGGTEILESEIVNINVTEK